MKLQQCLFESVAVAKETQKNVFGPSNFYHIHAKSYTMQHIHYVLQKWMEIIWHLIRILPKRNIQKVAGTLPLDPSPGLTSADFLCPSLRTSRDQ